MMLIAALSLAIAAQTAERVEGIPTQLIERWGDCLNDRGVALDSPAMTPDQVADAAFAACRDNERLVEAAERQIDTAEALASRMDGTRRGLRGGLVFQIRQRRGLPDQGNATNRAVAAWGNCVNERVAARVVDAENADAIFAAAFQACAEQEHLLRTVISSTFTPTETDNLISMLRDRLQRQSLTDVR